MSHLQTNQDKQLDIKPKKDKKKYYYRLFIGFFFLCSSAFLINAVAIKAFGLQVPESKLGSSKTSSPAKASIKALENIPILGEFLSGKVQAKIESRVTDYFIPREDILLANYTVNNKMNESFYKLILPKKTLVPLDDG